MHHFSICFTASGFHRAKRRRRQDPVRVIITAGNMHGKANVASSQSRSIPKVIIIPTKFRRGRKDAKTLEKKIDGGKKKKGGGVLIL